MASMAAVRTWKGLDEQAAYNDQHMSQPHVCFPIPLQHIHADLAWLGDIGMEDLREEEACTPEGEAYSLPCT